MTDAIKPRDRRYGPEILELIRANAAPWIRAQRATHRPRGLSIPQPTTEALKTYVHPGILDPVRIVEVTEFVNPPFYDQLEAAGVGMPLDFRSSDGVTFDDTILIRKAERSSRRLESLLFHELVHVVQYASLGVEGFAERYIRGWVNAGFSYFDIPLEQDAYELQACFEKRDRFNLEEEVAARLRSRQD